jgi:glycosyltransferase involved in cell wall biosynthesis
VTHVGGTEELVAHGQNGWFIERDAEMIADRLRHLGADRDSMKKMGAAAREATRDMSWDRVIGAYAALYRDLATRP